MNENDRRCDFKIISFVNGIRTEIACKPNNGCLRNFVWSGIGVRTAAAIALGRPNSENVDAYVKGTCSGESKS